MINPGLSVKLSYLMIKILTSYNSFTLSHNNNNIDNKNDNNNSVIMIKVHKNFKNKFKLTCI